MRVLILWAYYPAYLEYFYDRHSGVAELGYREHLEELLDDHFGWPGELSLFMNRKGIDTEFVVTNDKFLQMKWADENGFSGYSDMSWEKEIAMAQIKQFKPDVLWVGAMFDYYGRFVREALDHCGQAITWISCPVPEELDVSGFSTLVTSKHGLLGDKERLFNRVVLASPGFDSSILNVLGPVKKNRNVVFVGGITPSHTKRAELLAHLIDNGVPVDVFGELQSESVAGVAGNLKGAVGAVVRRGDLRAVGNLLRRSKPGSIAYSGHLARIATRHSGPVYGLDMYRMLASSRLALNVHIDVAGNCAGNMRMFEVTGVGSCLVTEQSDNIEDLFIPGKEVLTYKDKEDLLRVVRQALDEPETYQGVAEAGQARTLADHNIERLFQEVEPALVN